MKIIFKPQIIEFSQFEKEEWLKSHKNTVGFGEDLASKYLENQGYKSIHHDFNVFGGNKPGKYPAAEEILLKFLGKDRFLAAKQVFKCLSSFHDPKQQCFEEPDLLVYREDFSEIKFVECKRLDTNDKLNKKQIRGLILLGLFLNIKVEVYLLKSKEKNYIINDLEFEVPMI